MKYFLARVFMLGAISTVPSLVQACVARSATDIFLSLFPILSIMLLLPSSLGVIYWFIRRKYPRSFSLQVIKVGILLACIPPIAVLLSILFKLLGEYFYPTVVAPGVNTLC